MEKLKQVIESTLINNLESADANYLDLTLESVTTCSDYISKEIQDLMIAWAKDYNGGKDDRFDVRIKWFLKKYYNES